MLTKTLFDNLVAAQCYALLVHLQQCSIAVSWLHALYCLACDSGMRTVRSPERFMVGRALKRHIRMSKLTSLHLPLLAVQYSLILATDVSAHSIVLCVCMFVYLCICVFVYVCVLFAVHCDPSGKFH